MKKLLIFTFISILTLFITAIGIGRLFYQNSFYFLKGEVQVEKISFKSDKNNNGISDLEDILQGARKEVEKKTVYKSAYYEGGYPLDSEGVCTDVIWRALKNAGIDLKSSMDMDIKQNLKDYSDSISLPDPNIDFRRVKNQYVYFKKFTENLTTEVIPYDKTNLAKWQPGDIVVVNNLKHVAIISDVRRRDGVPYILHNANSYAKEENLLMLWSKNNKIIGHFRYR
jgi:uncharacterized protein YijF (DUF1287 family)